MTLRILSSLALGILAGLFLLPQSIIGLIGPVADISLAILLFTVGFELGQDAKLGQKIRDLPKVYLTVPFLIAIGSIVGSIIAGAAIRMSIGDASLVGAGFGWYSLSAVIITQNYDVTLGALALLTNVFREVLAMLLIPTIAKRIGFLPAVAPGGATTMDVTLPLVAQNTDAQTTLIAFYSGTVLSTLVPIVVPLIIALLQRLA
ncbi:MAG TPA: lysine exporter LysO family protein [Firmicutes bacterium]|nr:lysine exporter LysO family protein [Bacillota bacterium]